MPFSLVWMNWLKTEKSVFAEESTNDLVIQQTMFTGTKKIHRLGNIF